MALKPPPPPTKSEPGSFAWMDWYRSLYDFITSAGSIAWNLIDFAGSNLTDIATRLHSSLQGITGTGAYHISATEATDVTNLSAGIITDVNYITFDTTPTGIPTTTPGTLFYDSADGNQTLSLVMGDGITTQQIGEEHFIRVKATATIADGQVVMFTGTIGASGALTGAPATGLVPTTALYIMGVATEAIPLNGWGYITSFGLVRGIDTTGGAEAWIDGQILYLDPTVAGGLTKTIPVAPNPKVVVAVVVRASATVGSLFIRPDYGGRLGDYEGDVNISSLTTGDLLQYNGTIWQNTPATSVLAGTYTAPVTKTANFTVASTETWLINNKAGSTCTVTLPVASSSTGRVLHIQNYQTQTVVSASSNVVPIVGGAAGTAILANVAGDTATLVSDGSNWIMTQYVPNNILLLE